MIDPQIACDEFFDYLAEEDRIDLSKIDENTVFIALGNIWAACCGSHKDQ